MAELFARAGLAALLGCAACAPDLERRTGTVQVVALNLPATAASLRATLRTSGAEATVEAPLATSGGRLRFTAVPEGSAEVTGEVLGAGAIAPQIAPLTVVATQTTSVVLDFGAVPMGTDAGVAPTPSRAFGPTPAFVRGLGSSELRGGVLTGTSDGVDGVFSSQLDAARQALGTVTRVRISGVTMTLNTATSREVSTLGELWSGPLSVSIASRDRPLSVVVASGSATAAEVTLEGAADQAGLDALLSDLSSQRAVVVLSGTSPQSESSEFRAELSVLLRWVAFSD